MSEVNSFLASAVRSSTLTKQTQSTGSAFTSIVAGALLCDMEGSTMLATPLKQDSGQCMLLHVTR